VVQAQSRGTTAVGSGAVPADPSPNQPDSRAKLAPRAALYEEVVDHLVRYIARQGLEPGQRLPAERVLAEELGVSRTSVRQALTVLRAAGVVEIRRSLGVYLARPVVDAIPAIPADLLTANPELPSVADVWEALESHAAGLAALRRTDAHIAELALANDQMQRELEAGDCGFAGDRRFHAAIVTAATSPVLADLLTSVGPTVEGLARASLDRKGQPPRSLAEHRTLFGAIVRGDRDEASRLMLDHIQVSGPHRRGG
jgi:GntR family transcriptional repressor for pyruvate dehydrogenase complex